MMLSDNWLFAPLDILLKGYLKEPKIIRQYIRRLFARQFMRDTATYQVGQFALIILQAITNFFLIRVLGREIYGAYALVQATAALAGALDLTGSGRVTLTQLSQAIGADDTVQIRDSLAYFLKINLIYNGPLILVFMLVAPQLSWLVYHEPHVSLFVGWLALTQLLDVPMQLANIAYQARGTIGSLVNFEISHVVLTTVMVFLVLVSGHTIGFLVFGTIAISGLYAGLSIWRYQVLTVADSRFPSWLVLIGRVRTVPNEGRFRLGFMVAIDKNLGALLDIFSLMFIGTLGVTALGDFSIARKIVTLPQPLISGISRNLDTFLPRRASQKSADQSSAQAIRTTFIETTVYVGALWSIVTLGIAAVGPILLLIAFPNYISALPMIFPLLLQSIGIGLGPGIGPMIRTLRRLEFSIGIQFLAILLIVPIGLFLFHIFGEYGAAWWIGLIEIAQVATMIFVLLWLTRSKPADMTPQPVQAQKPQ